MSKSRLKYRCASFHKEVAYDGPSCPVCDLQEHLYIQQERRDAALKLADELEEEESNNYGYEPRHNGYTAAERIRAIYADKEQA